MATALARRILCLGCIFSYGEAVTIHHRRSGRTSRSVAVGLWVPCGTEGEVIRAVARSTSRGLQPVRFGWEKAWVEASLPGLSHCSLGSFGGVDPAPNIRKVCQCLSEDTGTAALASSSVDQERNDLGIMWFRCADEGGTCTCPAQSTLVRFGATSRWVSVAQQPPAAALTPASRAPLQCIAADFNGLDPAPSRRKECWCEASTPHSAGQDDPGKLGKRDARVAIVMLTRHPPELKTWLQYHIGYMKVDHVFFRVEDTPDFANRIQALPIELQQRVSILQSQIDIGDTIPQSAAAAESPPADDYESLQTRQLSAMAEARADAAAMGIDWLIHIDDDELLYTPVYRSVGELLAAIPKEIDQAYIPNVEALYPSAEVQNCFTETSSVNMNRYTFQAYANGKSAVRVAAADVHPAGPHQWRNSWNDEPPSLHLDAETFGAPLMVIHFESCPFSHWKDKFRELDNASPEQIDAIPFQFYRSSIKRMQSCSSSMGSDEEASTSGTCDDASLKKFWISWKTEANSAITATDIMPLQIPWRTIVD